MAVAEMHSTELTRSTLSQLLAKVKPLPPEKLLHLRRPLRLTKSMMPLTQSIQQPKR